MQGAKTGTSNISVTAVPFLFTARSRNFFALGPLFLKINLASAYLKTDTAVKSWQCLFEHHYKPIL